MICLQYIFQLLTDVGHWDKNLFWMCVCHESLYVKKFGAALLGASEGLFASREPVPVN